MGCQNQAEGTIYCPYANSPSEATSTTYNAAICPSPPPASPSFAGNDPIFVAANGQKYEVKGEAGHSFNLVTSPSLSVNAEFQAVPPGFQYIGLPDDEGTPLNARNLTETVLGDMHVVICTHHGDKVGLLLNMSSGAHRCDVNGRLADCNSILPSASVEVNGQVVVCDLEDMVCRWHPAAAAHSSLMELAKVQPGFTRINVSIPLANFTLSRDSISNFPTLRCSNYARWPAALSACLEVAAYEAHTGSFPSNATIERWKGILSAEYTMFKPSLRFWFGQLMFTHLDLPQPMVHGLLGQHAAAAAGDSLTGSTARVSPVAEGVQRAGITATGKQGEGVIEGSYLDYKLKHLTEHVEHKYSKFKCHSTASV